MAKLAGGVAVIQVGAATETELKEKKHRIEDALAATKAGVEEGMVPGGGAALIHAMGAVDKLQAEGDELTGIRSVSYTHLDVYKRQILVKVMPCCPIRAFTLLTLSFDLTNFTTRGRVKIINNKVNKAKTSSCISKACLLYTSRCV